MDRSLQQIRASEAEGQHGDGERDAKDGDILDGQAEVDFLLHDQANSEDGGDREREGGEGGTEEEVDGALELVFQGGLDGAQALGGENEKRDDHAGESCGEPEFGGSKLEDDGEFFCENHDGNESGHEKDCTGDEAGFGKKGQSRVLSLFSVFQSALQRV